MQEPTAGVRAWLQDHWGRLVGGLALTAVAAVAGVISYGHIEALTLAEHQPIQYARLYPIGVDGMIVVGSVVLLQATRKQPWLGWLGVVPGVAASLFANWESGIRYGWLSATWATVPAASFALATFLLERWLTNQAGHLRATAGQCPHGVPSTMSEAVVSAFLHGRDCLGDEPSQRHLSASFDLSRQRVAELVGTLNGSTP
jgi:hypothetical protein